MTAERRITLKTDIQGANQVDSLQKALAGIKFQASDSTRGLSQIGDALTQRTIPPLQEYKKLWDSSGQAVAAFGGMAAASLGKLNQEFQRQKTLGEFYGTGTMRTSLLSLNNATREFLSGGGRGFTSWLEGAGTRLAQYRLALAGAAAGMAAFGAAAAFSAKNTGNMIDSVMKIHHYRIADEDKTRAWLESALTTDWSGGRKERSTVYGTLMSKRIMNEQTAISTTEAIEKYWFANKEYLQSQGVSSSEDLANILMSDSGNEEQLRAITSKYNLDKVPAFKRGAIMQQLAADLDMDAEVDKRPEEVLKKRLEHTTTNIGKTLIPVLNQILGAFLKLSEVLGKIPGADKMAGWGIVLVGGVATLTMLLPLLSSMLSTIRLLAPAIKLVGVAFRGALIGTGVGALLVATGLLAGFLYKTGMLQKAWDKFKGSAIGKDLAKGLVVAGEYAEKLAGYVGSVFDKLDKAYSKGSIGGALKMALEFSSPMVKIFLTMAEYLRRLLEKSDFLNKIMKRSSGIFEKIKEWLEKLTGFISLMKAGIDNLLSQIPGAEKREARGELDEAARRRGLKYVGDGQFTYMNDEPVSAEEIQKNYASLGQQAAEYEEMPGFWGDMLGALLDLPQKIAEALQRVMPSVFGSPALAGAEREAAFTKWLSDKADKGGKKYDDDVVRRFFDYMGMPVTDENLKDRQAARAALSTEIGGTALSDWEEKYGELSKGTPPATTQAATAAKGAATTVTDIDTYTGAPESAGEAALQGAAMNFVPGYNIYKMGEGLLGLKNRLIGADVGGTILSTGPLIGHEGEEIVPANVKRGGETVLERMMNYGVAGPMSGSGSPQTVSFNPTINVEIGRVDSDVDVDRLVGQIRERLVFSIRNDLENLYTRNIGYLRG